LPPLPRSDATPLHIAAAITPLLLIAGYAMLPLRC